MDYGVYMCLRHAFKQMLQCSEGHSEEEKRTLTQLYIELDQENPDLEKIDQLLRAPAFNQLAVDHVCDDTSQLSALEHACLKVYRKYCPSV